MPCEQRWVGQIQAIRRLSDLCDEALLFVWRSHGKAELHPVLHAVEPVLLCNFAGFIAIAVHLHDACTIARNDPAEKTQRSW